MERSVLGPKRKMFFNPRTFGNGENCELLNLTFTSVTTRLDWFGYFLDFQKYPKRKKSMRLTF